MTIAFHWDKVDNPAVVFQHFASRRSVVYGTKGVVAASQPLAVEAGLEILRKGGNAGWFTLEMYYYDFSSKAKPS
jgi:gamma-glutamyltranspeptidase / glutathione hydrolase